MLSAARTADTEHQMADAPYQLAADPQVAAAGVILDAGIGTFGRRFVSLPVGSWDRRIPDQRRLARSAAISALSAVSRRVLRSITGTRNQWRRRRSSIDELRVVRWNP